MADAVIKFKVMPESADADFENIKGKLIELAKGFEMVGDAEFSEEPIGFGLKALIFKVVIPEEYGSSDLEEKICDMEEIQSAQVLSFSRAMG
jgi:elongation factor 1-beta